MFPDTGNIAFSTNGAKAFGLPHAKNKNKTKL